MGLLFIPVEKNTINFAVPDMYAEVKNVLYPEIGVVDIYAPAQFLSSLEAHIRNAFYSYLDGKSGKKPVYKIKTVAGNPMLVIRTGRNDSTVSTMIGNWVKSQKSSALANRLTVENAVAENPENDKRLRENLENIFGTTSALTEESNLNMLQNEIVRLREPVTVEDFPPLKKPEDAIFFPSQPVPNTNNPESGSHEVSKKTNWLLYSLIAVIVIGIIYYISKKK